MCEYDLRREAERLIHNPNFAAAMQFGSDRARHMLTVALQQAYDAGVSAEVEARKAASVPVQGRAM